MIARSLIHHVFLVTVALCITSCKKQVTLDNLERQHLLGTWNVQWVTKPDPNQPIPPGINYTMNGKMVFEAELLTTSAYGYKGCIFGTDTLNHSLRWVLQGDTLKLYNDGDNFGLPYKIKEVSNNRIQLQLLDDVFLFLSK